MSFEFLIKKIGTSNSIASLCENLVKPWAFFFFLASKFWAYLLILVFCEFYWIPEIFYSEITETPSTSESHTPSVQTELIMLSLPAIAGQAIEPLAQLMETAYIGRLG